MTSPSILVELTSTMGLALFKVQQAERVLKFALQWVGVDPDVTLAGLEAREASLRKSTLGQTLGLFKKHIGFEENFDAVMSEFLDNRNTFVHHFLSLPGFSLDSDENVAVGIDFLRKLITHADLLTKVMQGLNQMMIVNNGKAPDGGELTDETFNEMLMLMNLRPKP